MMRTGDMRFIALPLVVALALFIGGTVGEGSVPDPCPEGVSSCTSYSECTTQGFAWDEEADTCECTGNRTWVGGTCMCGEGQVWTGADCEEEDPCLGTSTYNATLDKCVCEGAFVYNASAGDCQALCPAENEEWDSVLSACACTDGFFSAAAAGTPCGECSAVCAEGFEETTACTPTTDRQCGVCAEGYYCTGGDKLPCAAPQGSFCPEGYTLPAGEAADPAAVEGVLCEAGYFCAGGSAPAVECTAEPGYYCPPAFAPGSGVPAEVAVGGVACPPAMECTGGTAQPEVEGAVCDLALACGAGDQACGTSESSLEAAFERGGLDCVRTEAGEGEWVRVELSERRRVGTVRFASAEGAVAAEFSVLVSRSDAEDGELPAGADVCAVAAGAEAGMLEATCPLGTKGQYVFVAKAGGEAVEVCGAVEVFDHVCQGGPEVTCPKGEQPAGCHGAEYCPGCVPCPAGTYSNREGPQFCMPCPGEDELGERPYSPPGSTSVFQCEGTAFLDGSSSLAVERVDFDTSTDSWAIVVDYTIATTVEANGVAALFVSKNHGGPPPSGGGDPFIAANFPCKLDGQGWSEGDPPTSETLCCLMDFRMDYFTTALFAGFSDALDLVDAHDECDAPEGSELLKSAVVEVVGSGTAFVDFSSRPTGVRAEPFVHDRKFKTKIIIPDSELTAVSRPVADAEGLEAGARELFVGLVDLQGTGGRVVDASSQQVAITVLRSQYGTFAAYGEQEINYDFLSWLNARAHHVVIAEPGTPAASGASCPSVCVHDDNSVHTAPLVACIAEPYCVPGDVDKNIPCEFGLCYCHAGMSWCPEGGCDCGTPNGRRDGAGESSYFAEVTFSYDKRLEPASTDGPVVLSSVMVNGEPACAGEVSAGFLEAVSQECGPTHVGWSGGATCPQVSAAEGQYGRLYVPLWGEMDGSVVHVAFDVHLADAEGRNASMHVELHLVTSRGFVGWCGAHEFRSALAGTVSPAIIVGSDPARLQGLEGWENMVDDLPFGTGAATVQDGLVTVVLELEEEAVADGLEVFFEDVVTMHINPGAFPAMIDIQTAVEGDAFKYLPSFQIDPDTNRGSLVLPAALQADCPAEDVSDAFFGCVHKHVLRGQAVTNASDAYVVGSGDAGAFMEGILREQTSPAAARTLGTEWEAYLLGEGVSGATGTKIGVMLNPGHRWGGGRQTLSEHVMVFVLFGVRSAAGTERRMLLEVAEEQSSGALRTMHNLVKAEEVVAQSLGDEVTAVPLEAEVEMPLEALCGEWAEKKAACETLLGGAVESNSVGVKAFECVRVEFAGNADPCAAERRAGPPGGAVADVEAVVALAKGEDSYLDVEAVMESEAVVSVREAEGSTAGQDVLVGVEEAAAGEGTEEGKEKEEGGGGRGVSTAVVAGSVVAGVLVLAAAAVGVWLLKRKKAAKQQARAMEEVVVTGEMAESDKAIGKEEVEKTMSGERVSGAGSGAQTPSNVQQEAKEREQEDAEIARRLQEEEEKAAAAAAAAAPPTAPTAPTAEAGSEGEKERQEKAREEALAAQRQAAAAAAAAAQQQREAAVAAQKEREAALVAERESAAKEKEQREREDAALAERLAAEELAGSRAEPAEPAAEAAETEEEQKRVKELEEELMVEQTAADAAAVKAAKLESEVMAIRAQLESMLQTKIPPMAQPPRPEPEEPPAALGHGRVGVMAAALVAAKAEKAENVRARAALEEERAVLQAQLKVEMEARLLRPEDAAPPAAAGEGGRVVRFEHDRMA